MNLISKLVALRGGNQLSALEEQALDELAYRVMGWFPKGWAYSKRVEELPAYVARQEELARELLTKLGIPWEAATERSTLERVWDHFLAVRRYVKRRRPLRGLVRGSVLRTHRADADTLRLMANIGALLGFVLQRAMPELRWVVGHCEEGEYLHEGVPILVGFPGDFPEMNPTQIVANLAGQSAEPPRPATKRGLTYHPATRGPDRRDLADLFERWVQGVFVPLVESEPNRYPTA